MKVTTRSLPKTLSEQESEALRRAASRARDAAAVGLMLDLGLRASEAVGLKLSDIDWSQQVLRFTGKGGRPAELPIPSRVRDVLEQALRQRPAAAAAHDRVLWSLPHPDRPLSRTDLWKLVRRLGIRVVGRAVWPHLLRHTCGSNLYRRYGDLAVVQRVLRHVKLETTAIYVHLSTEQQREHLEALDSRPWWERWWQKLKPRGLPAVLRLRPPVASFKETVGRTQEFGQLRQCVSRRQHCLLVGLRGSGRRHLLGHITGERIYRLERLSPVRQALVELCVRLHRDGLLSEVPKSRSTAPFVKAVTEAGGGSGTLVIESLEGLNRQEEAALRRLCEGWTVLAGVDPETRLRATRVFFGRALVVELGPLSRAECLELARRALAKARLQLADEAEYLAHVWSESAGNPGAVLALVEQTQKSGVERPEHTETQRVVSATPLLAFVCMLIMVSRYPASALSEPQWKVWATVLLFGLLPVVLLDKILKQRRRPNR